MEEDCEEDCVQLYLGIFDSFFKHIITLIYKISPRKNNQIKKIFYSKSFNSLLLGFVEIRDN